MGAKLSKHFFSPKREERSSNPNDRSSSQGLSIVEFMKLECFKAKKSEKKIKKRKQLQQPEKKIAKARKLTLEDWLLASPGRPGLKPGHLDGDELNVFKQFSKRVHPSASTRHCEEAVPCTPRDNFSLVDVSSAVNRLSIDNVSTIANSRRSSLSRSESGKSKKRVSFKLPKEADIILFYSPEETFGCDLQQESS